MLHKLKAPDKRFIVIAAFDTAEQCDAWYNNAQKAFANNTKEVDFISMASRMRKGVVHWYTPFSSNWWSEIFRYLREVYTWR